MLALQSGIAYGPMQSRRLGRSLGVNVLPLGRKVCNFDCVYCQYGEAQAETDNEAAQHKLPSPETITAAVESALLKLSEPPAYLTLSGNGEATLHPQLNEIVSGLRAVRDRHAPSTRLAILSNSSRVHEPRVRAALALLDVRIMKLDVGTEQGLARFNRPSSDVRLEQIVAGLRALPRVTLQALFAGGPCGNVAPKEVSAWMEQVVSIQPEHVQIYTLDRDPARSELVRVARDQLESIQYRLKAYGIEASVYG